MNKTRIIYVDLCFQEKKNTKKSGLTSSKQFFSQLQDEVTTHIQAKKAVKLKKEKKRHSASKLKL